jgi:hypothetical protein
MLDQAVSPEGGLAACCRFPRVYRRLTRAPCRVLSVAYERFDDSNSAVFDFRRESCERPTITEGDMKKSETPAKVRRAIATLTAVHGHAPSIVEIARLVGVSPNRAFTAAMEEVQAGRLTHTPGVHRSWRVIGEV